MVEYNNLRFSEQQKIVIRKSLQLAPDVEVDDICPYIAGALGYYVMVKNFRDVAPDIKTARAKAQSVLDCAKGLRASIDAHNISGIYFKSNKNFVLGKSRRLLDFEADNVPIKIFQEMLSYIIETATYNLKNEDNLRAINAMPRKEVSNLSMEVQALWPGLFYIYSEFSGGMSYSAGGPLERFVSVVHEAAGLRPVSSATLKNAVIQWKQDKARNEMA